MIDLAKLCQAERIAMAQRIPENLGNDLERIFSVHLAKAEAHMTPQQITEMLVTIATNVGKAASVCALRHMANGQCPQEVCDSVEATIARKVRDARPQVLKAFDALSAAEAKVG